jgi:hypothetical protein
MKGDLVPRLPNVRWTRVTDVTPGFEMRINFGAAGTALPDVARGALQLLRSERADGGTWPVIDLEPPDGGDDGPRGPGDSHSLEESYLPALRQLWQPVQRQGEWTAMPRAPAAPVKPEPLARGGIAADIRIDERDFLNCGDGSWKTERSTGAISSHPPRCCPPSPSSDSVAGRPAVPRRQPVALRCAPSGRSRLRH